MLADAPDIKQESKPGEDLHSSDMIGGTQKGGDEALSTKRRFSIRKWIIAEE